MLDANIDTLFDIAVADTFVDDDADSGFGDIVDNACFSVVHLVDSSFLHSTIDFEVHNIANPTILLALYSLPDKDPRPYLYTAKYVESLIMPFCLNLRENA